jgi:hypothetical protein
VSGAVASRWHPVAAAAVADPALEQFLTVLPIIQSRGRQDRASKARQAEALPGRARNLAAQLPSCEAVDLLTVIDPETASSQQFDCLAVFARAPGRNTPDPQPVLARLLDATFLAAVPLLSGLLRAWPQECFTWLSANITTGHVAELALWIADDLPADQETVLLDTVTAQLTAACTGNGAGTDAGQTSEGDTPGPGDEHPGGGPDPAIAALTVRVADHLGWCRAQPADRLN